MSAAVLADLYGLQPGSGPASAGPLADLVRQAAAEGQSPAYVDALVNEAAARGRVEVPPLLRTTEGRVDTAVLLAGLGLAEDETGEGDAAARDLAADPVSARLDLGPATYTVLPGDSLSALALRYYGDAARATEIHAANLSVLATADSLHVGQKLVLPQR
jgi:nucleoid-associated protein YgaU